MVSANSLVEVLLEDRARVCADCQQEQGTTPARGETHGWCYRHALERWTRDLYGGDVEAAKQKLATYPASFFSPDMQQQSV